jgi:hypothetical protein
LKSINPYQRIITIAIGVGVTIGVVLGLVYGYLINPVKWVDTSLEVARSDIQEDYLRMAIDAYNLHLNPSQAQYRYQELGDSGADTLENITQSPGVQGIKAVAHFRELVYQDFIASNDIAAVTPEVVEDNTAYLYLWVSTIFLGGIVSVYYYLRTHPQESGQVSRSGQSAKIFNLVLKGPKPFLREKPSRSIPASEFETPPLLNFMCTYIMGDKLEDFEESFSLDTDKGEFLGECGIELIHVNGEENPAGASAFDLWLFDKNEINTKSIMLMSDRVYSDDVLRTQLETKGVPTKAIIGRESIIETDHLLMKFRIVDMVGVKGEMGKFDYFTRLSVDINIWQVEA